MNATEAHDNLEETRAALATFEESARMEIEAAADELRKCLWRLGEAGEVALILVSLEHAAAICQEEPNT